MLTPDPPPSPKERLERLRRLLRRSRQLVGKQPGPLLIPEPGNEATELVEEAAEDAQAVLESDAFTGVLGFSELLVTPLSLPAVADEALVLADNALYHFAATKPPNIEQTAVDLTTLLDLIQQSPGGYIHLICHGQDDARPDAGST